MRRALVVLAVAAVAAGGALIAFGMRDHTPPKFEAHLPRLPITTSTVLLPEGTWTFGSGPAGFAVGRMHITGGPKTRRGAMPDNPLAGVVEVHSPGDATVLGRISVGATGTFRIDLPVGNYQLIGRANVDEEIDSHAFSIRAGQATAIDLVVIAT